MFWRAETLRIPLPAAEFDRRHRGLQWLLALHLIALPLFGLAKGFPLTTGLVIDAPLAAFGLLSAWPRLSRTARASMAVMGLLCCSAGVVWLWRGQTEAHFHYFVIVGAVALYEAWLPYAIAFGFVVLQHGIMSAYFPNSVFEHASHMGGMHHEWGWAAIHGGFIGALALANMASWRASEDSRRREREASAAQLRSSERFRVAFASAPNGMALMADDGTIIELNDALAASTGARVADLRDRPWSDMLPESERAAARGQWPPDEAERELPLLRSDGSIGHLLWKVSRLHGDDGPARWIAQTTDVSRRKEAERELAFHATHDALTGLPNRSEFNRLAQAALEERDPREAVAVLFADVDNFKTVNDSLGHAAGDELLLAVSARLRSALRADDLIGRFGGDEFVVCLRGTDATAAYAAAARLDHALEVPFLLANVERPVTASFGLALAGPDDDSIETLLLDADAAMYEAKRDGKARTRVFGPGMRDAAMERLDLEADLREAVANDAIEPYYQPQVSLEDGRVTGVEVLARWRHPVRGNIPPVVFIPIAEQSGLVSAIGAAMLRKGSEQAMRWAAADPLLGDLRISVNVSPRCLCNLELPAVVRDILAGTGLAPERVCLEITESAVVDRGDRPARVVAQLKEIGIQIAIDDFGVGQSSLSQLSRLRGLDELKIDKSFIDDIDEDSGQAARELVRAIVAVSTSGGVSVVVEGIERPAQLAELLKTGCPIGQGYLFSRPLPAAEIEPFLTRRHVLSLVG